MPRYFLEVAYKGTNYSGFQVQENAVTIQSEIEKALLLIQREAIYLTGSSRTDSGVHALQNFFHFDYSGILHPQLLYKLNAVLEDAIAVKGIYPVGQTAHSRFDAVSRGYEYRIYTCKNPFLKDLAYFYPYTVDKAALQTCAAIIREQTNFWGFSKTNTQVKNFNCTIYNSEWEEREGLLIYKVEGNRFLRGMVRLLTATQLKVGRGLLTTEAFLKLFEGKSKAGFSIAAAGLYLKEVKYPEGYFKEEGN